MERKKKVRLQDIAEAMGISIVTVSNALNGRSGVSESLAEEICRKAEEMGYRLHAESRKKEKEAYVFGVIVAERYVKEFPSFYMDIYKWITQEAMKRGSLTMLEVVDESREKLEQRSAVFSGIGVDGIIIVGEMAGAYIKALMAHTSVPVVCVDYYDTIPGLDYIVTDSYGGMEQVTELVLDAGHKKLAFVGGTNTTKNILDRYLGFCKALMKRGLDFRDAQLIPDRAENLYDYKLRIELPEELPDAFVCNCDKSAGILLNLLHEKGIRVPDDVSVVGFDHYQTQTETKLELITYENDEKVIAQISVSTLLGRIEGKRKPEGVRVIIGEVVSGNTLKDKRSE